MKAKELKKILAKIPDNAELVISKPFLINVEGDYKGILDIPIRGIATNELDEKELRFVLDLKDAKECFSKKQLKLI